MDFVISNKPFKDSINFGSLYYKGDAHVTENYLVILDGECVEYTTEQLAKIPPNDFAVTPVHGIFVYVGYDALHNLLVIKNDKLGKIPTFLFKKGNHFILTNCLWEIVRNVSYSDIEILPDILKKTLFFFYSFDEESTFFKNITTLPYATLIKIDINSLNFIKSRYWDYSYNPDYDLTIEEAFQRFDSDMNRFFQFITRRNPNKVFAFGNSGGLDSRLLAIYAKQYNLPVLSFITGEERPFGYALSISHKNSIMIAKHLGISNYFVNYTDGKYHDQALLDLRNNPLGPSQVFKNPVARIPEFDILLTGHPGISVGGMVKYDHDKMSYEELLNYMLDYFTIYKWRYSLYYGRLRRILRKFLPKEKNKRDALGILNFLYNSNDIADYRTHIVEFLEKNLEKGKFFSRQKYAATILERWQYCGGFESLSRTKKTYYFYYPFAFDNILKWPPKFIVNRVILREIIKRKDPVLNYLPEQSGKSVLARLFRGTGLDYWKWTLRHDFQKFLRGVLNRKNDLFDSIFNRSLFWSYQINKTPLAIEILKLKMLTDAIVDGAADNLIEFKWKKT